MATVFADERRLSPYLSFSRAEWSHLRNGAELPISAEELDTLVSLNDTVSLEDVADVYLPLLRLLQLYYDVGTTNAWRPYVGAGVGVANGRPNELTCMTLCSSLDDADRAIGYQFMAGVTYAPKKDITFFAEHRLSGTARGSIIDTDGARSDVEGMRDRAFGGGVRIGF